MSNISYYIDYLEDALMQGMTNQEMLEKYNFSRDKLMFKKEYNNKIFYLLEYNNCGIKFGVLMIYDNSKDLEEFTLGGYDEKFIEFKGIPTNIFFMFIYDSSGEATYIHFENNCAVELFYQFFFGEQNTIENDLEGVIRDQDFKNKEQKLLRLIKIQSIFN